MSTNNTPPLSASFPPSLARYTDVLEAALRSAVPQDDVPLHRALRYHMGWADPQGIPIAGAGGKRLRPILCLMTCEAVGGSLLEAMPAAVAVELVHNFSLVHDDIQDRDRERHQRPTVWTLWGEPQAMSVGNALYSLACKAMLDLARHQVASPVVLQALAKLMNSSLAMLEGQYLDLEFEQRLDVTPQEYLDMISLKTGALISCAMEMGSLVGSEDPSTVALFLQSGLHIGQLFQLRDDVLGIWGDSATTGKPMHSDIQRKKKTFPVVYAFQHATGAGAKTLHRLYQKEQLHGDDVRQVVEVVEATGARREAHRRASMLADQALESLLPVELAANSRRDMEDLVSFLLYRER